jgi:hypothetical protein
MSKKGLLGSRDGEKGCEKVSEALRKEQSFVNIKIEHISLTLVMRRWPINVAIPSTPPNGLIQKGMPPAFVCWMSTKPW